MEEAYRRQITGEGPTYRERQKGQVHCRECGEEMAAVSLETHLMTHHGRVAEARWSWRTMATGDRTRTFRMDFPAKGGPWSSLVEGCPAREATRTACGYN